MRRAGRFVIADAPPHHGLRRPTLLHCVAPLDQWPLPFLEYIEDQRCPSLAPEQKRDWGPQGASRPCRKVSGIVIVLAARPVRPRSQN